MDPLGTVSIGIYQQLNYNAKKNCYLFPRRVTNFSSVFFGYQWFYPLDLKSGCRQVEIYSDDPEKIAFTKDKDFGR